MSKSNNYLNYLFNPLLFLGKQIGILIPFFIMLLFVTGKFKPKFNLEDKKLIDIKNNSGWIHTSQLSKRKSFILLEDQLLFAKPTKYSKPILKIAKGRLLLVKKCKKKWCKVKTENYFGWIRTNNIWGNIK